MDVEPPAGRREDPPIPDHPLPTLQADTPDAPFGSSPGEGADNNEGMHAPQASILIPPIEL